LINQLSLLGELIMLKRNIGILIAGALLSAQVNLAAADQGAFPMSADEPGRGVLSTLPAQVNYLEERAVRPQVATVRVNTFPQTENDIIWKPLPAQAKYLEERVARPQVATVRVNTFPPSADDMVWKPLPAQARYFERREATLQARKLDVSAPGGE
jgi:hypothetical protein